MGAVRILGLDPGLAHFGYAVLEIEGLSERLVVAGIIETKPESGKKRRLNAGDDFFNRLHTVGSALKGVLERHKATIGAIEAITFPRSSSAASKLASAHGLAIMAAIYAGIPLVCVHRSDVYTTIGIPHASKEQVMAFVEMRYPDATWPVRSKREHAADATVTALTAAKAPAFAPTMALLQRV